MPHVQPGAPLDIKARDWSRTLDLIQDPNETVLDPQATGSLPALVIRAKNDSGVDLPKHAAAPYSSVSELFTAQPVSDDAPNDRMPVISIRPAAEFNEDRPSLGVLMKPIPAGRIGPVCIAGGCWARFAPTATHPYSHFETPAATLVGTGASAYMLRPITEGPADIIYRNHAHGLGFVRLGNERRATRASRFVMATAGPLSPVFSILTGGFPNVTIPLQPTHQINSAWQAGSLTDSISPSRTGLYFAAMSIGVRNEGRAAPLQAALASTTMGPAGAVWAWDTLPSYSIYDSTYPIASLNSAGIIESTTAETWVLQVVDLVALPAQWKVLAAEVSLWRIR